VSAVLFVVCAPAGVLVRARCCECGLSSRTYRTSGGAVCARERAGGVSEFCHR